MAVLVVVLAVVSAVVFSVKRRTQKRKSVIVDEWIKALQAKQAEAKEMGSAPAVIEGVTMAPPAPAAAVVVKEKESTPAQDPTPGFDQDMLTEMRQGPYGSMHRAQRIQRGVRFSVQANHGPR